MRGEFVPSPNVLFVQGVLDQSFDLHDCRLVHLVAYYRSGELPFVYLIFHYRFLFFFYEVGLIVQNGFQAGNVFFRLPNFFWVFQLPYFMLEPKIEQRFFQVIDLLQDLVRIEVSDLGRFHYNSLLSTNRVLMGSL
jgi:hypothetical protein